MTHRTNPQPANLVKRVFNTILDGETSIAGIAGWTGLAHWVVLDCVNQLIDEGKVKF